MDKEQDIYAFWGAPKNSSLYSGKTQTSPTSGVSGCTCATTGKANCPAHKWAAEQTGLDQQQATDFGQTSNTQPMGFASVAPEQEQNGLFEKGRNFARNKYDEYFNREASSYDYINECTPEAFVKNFITATKQAPSTKPITTGNPVVDYGMQSKLSSKVPFLGSFVKALNIGNNIIGPNVARTHNALAESCFCYYCKNK